MVPDPAHITMVWICGFTHDAWLFSHAHHYIQNILLDTSMVTHLPPYPLLPWPGVLIYLCLALLLCYTITTQISVVIHDAWPLSLLPWQPGSLDYPYLAFLFVISLQLIYVSGHCPYYNHSLNLGVYPWYLALSPIHITSVWTFGFIHDAWPFSLFISLQSGPLGLSMMPGPFPSFISLQSGLLGLSMMPGPATLFISLQSGPLGISMMPGPFPLFISLQSGPLGLSMMPGPSTPFISLQSGPLGLSMVPDPSPTLTTTAWFPQLACLTLQPCTCTTDRLTGLSWAVCLLADWMNLST